MMLSQLSQPTVPAYKCRSEALLRAWDSFFVPFSDLPPLTCGFVAVPRPTPKGAVRSWDSLPGGVAREYLARARAALQHPIRRSA